MSIMWSPDEWPERRDPIGAALNRARQNGYQPNIADTEIAAERDDRYIVHAVPRTGWSDTPSGLAVWGLHDDRQWYIRSGMGVPAGKWWRVQWAKQHCGRFA